MKPKQFLKTGTVVMILFLMMLLPVYAAGDVVIQGKLNNNGKGILASDGKQYTIIPSESLEGQLARYIGQQVELTGVTYVSHGRNMITAFSFRLSN
jgi:hypothetical protein